MPPFYILGAINTAGSLDGRIESLILFVFLECLDFYILQLDGLPYIIIWPFSGSDCSWSIVKVLAKVSNTRFFRMESVPGSFMIGSSLILKSGGKDWSDEIFSSLKNGRPESRSPLLSTKRKLDSPVLMFFFSNTIHLLEKSQMSL